jgi:hypothetical protein
VIIPKATLVKRIDKETEWELKNALIRREFPPKLRAYLGKNYK